MGTTRSKTPSFIEFEGKFITKPVDVANYFIDDFKSKVDIIRNQKRPKWPAIRCPNKKHITPNKQFMITNAEEIKILLISVKRDKPNGVDTLDGKLLRLLARFVAYPRAYILNLCFKQCVLPTELENSKGSTLANKL